MPPVLVALAAIGWAMAASVTVTTAIVIGAIAVTTVVAMAATIGYMMSSMGGMPSMPGYSSEVRERSQVVKSAVAAHRVIYGTCMVSGPLVYALSSGSSNEYIWLVVVLASHEVEEIGDVYLSDKLSTDSKFGSNVTIWKHLGTADQIANSDLIEASGGQWTTDHRLLGRAYLVVRLKYDSDSFPNGIPNVKAVVKGKKIYDPRTETTYWSDNWGLCILDYLLSKYGLNCSLNDINLDLAIAAANISDEEVALVGGGTEKRYRCNGTYDLSQIPVEIMKKLLTAAVGSVVWSQGKYNIHAGAYTLPVLHLDETDLRGNLEVQTGVSRKDKFNTVRGTYVSPDNAWQQTDFPIVKNSIEFAKDGGELVQNVELPFTITSAAAQRIAKIHLERCLQGIVVTFPAKFTAFKLQPKDTVTLSIAKMGWDHKEFTVTSWTLAENGGIDLMLREESSAIYDWNSGEETVIDPAPNTTLPDPWDVKPPNDLTLTEELSGISGKVLTNLIVDVVPANDAFISRYEVEYKRSDATTWIGLNTNSLRGVASGVDDGYVYDVRARSLSQLGVYSAYIQKSVLILGFNAPPANLTTMRINCIGTEAHLSWVPLNDIALSHYILKFSPTLGGASWSNSVVLIPQISGNSISVPAMIGTYLLKAVRYGGSESLQPISAESSITGILGLNSVEVFEPQPTWSGTKTQTEVVSNKLALTLESGSYAHVGTYESDTIIDLTEVYTSRLTAKIEADGINVANVLASWPTLTAVPSLSGANPGEWTVSIQVATTNDNPALDNWSDWKEFVVGDYSARAFKFKLILESYLDYIAVEVTSLTVNIDMPDRTISEKDVTCPSNGLRIDYAPAFKTLNGLAVDSQDMQTGDYKTITNKDETGFNIQFFNSSNTGVARTFDYVAIGYGVKGA